MDSIRNPQEEASRGEVPSDGLLQGGGEQLECLPRCRWGIGLVEGGDPLPDHLRFEVAELEVAEVFIDVPVDVDTVAGFGGVAL